MTKRSEYNKYRTSDKGKDDKKSLSEEAAGDLYKMWIKQLLKHKPDEVDKRDWLNLLFDIENREIFHIKFTKEITIKGKRRISHSSWIKDNHPSRYILRNYPVTVRYDARVPSVYELEVNGNLFKIDREEYEQIKKYSLPLESDNRWLI